MCPQEAGVYFFEDDRTNIQITGELLKRAGHRVIGAAHSLETGLEAIPHLNEMGVQVALVDGKLSKNAIDVYDGETITAAIHAQCPGVFVIGYSSDHDIPGADVNCRKTEPIGKLVEAITNA